MHARARVVVVGGGISGLVCARRLTAAGLDVTVLEKARGPGGRMSSRHTEHGAFDHGAQYFTVRDARFRQQVDTWLEVGFVAEWTGRLVALDAGAVTAVSDDIRRFVGVPRMSAITRNLSDDVDLLTRYSVERIERRGGEWWVEESRGDSLGPFAGVAVAVPAPQAVPLLSAAPDLASAAGSVVMIGCHATMLSFKTPLDLPFDAAFIDDGALSWATRDNSKPGRLGPERWVLHSSPAWSEENIQLEPGAVPAVHLAAFERAVDRRLPLPTFAAAHRWRCALPIKTLEEACLWDGSLGLGACGDWCGGPRVEGAFLSGLALAREILEWSRGA